MSDNQKTFTNQDKFVSYVQSESKKLSNNGNKLAVKIYRDVTQPPVVCAFYFPPESNSRTSVVSTLDVLASVIKENEELKERLRCAEKK